MALRSSSQVTALIAGAFTWGSLMSAPAWGFSELGQIPIPAALRPPLMAACQAWGKHLEELIAQHRAAGELSDEEIDKATTQFYAAKAYCSMGKVLDALTMFEKVSLERVKRRPLW